MAIVNAQLKNNEYVNIIDPLGDNAAPYVGAVPEGKSYAITNILVCNNGSATAQFDMHLVPQGEEIDNFQTRVINNLELPAQETFTFDNEKIILQEGDRIVFAAQPAIIPADTVATAIKRGRTYEIQAAGTSDFTTFGSTDNNPGTTFVASRNGGVSDGTGTVKLYGYTNLAATVSYLEV